MRSAFALALALAMVAAAATVTSSVVADNAAEDRYLVGFWSWDPEGPRAGASDYEGERVVGRHSDLRLLVVEVSDRARFLDRAQHDSDVRFVEWDDPAYARLEFVPNDALYGDAGHWGSKKIGAEAAWDRTLGSAAVKVAMVDSGLNKAHEEFVGQARVLQGFDFVNNDNDPDDTSGCGFHGTHTTGTAGATLDNAKGIAGLSQHTILPVKAFSPGPFGCTGGISGLVNAITYTADQGAHISSNSWGGGSRSAALNDAVTSAHGRGVSHVAAAGNSGPCDECVSFPWRDLPSIVLIVAASDSEDRKASFSSEWPEVDVIAPGVGVLGSTSGTGGYATKSGTSMATPHASGTAALVKALNPSFGFTDIENKIKSTAVDIGLPSEQQGAGRLNADGATAGAAPPPPPPAPTPPGAPTLSATAGNAQVSLSWTTPSDGGSPITGYKVYRGTASGGESLYATLGVVNSYTDTGVTNGVTYFYKVTAVNAVGEGAFSNEVSALPTAPPPPASSVHTHAIDAFRTGKTPKFKIWAFNNNEVAEAGVSVSVQVCKSGGSCATGTGSTGSDGSVTFAWPKANSGTYQTCVTKMVKSGFDWDQAAGHASAGNCHTETV